MCETSDNKQPFLVLRQKVDSSSSNKVTASSCENGTTNVPIYFEEDWDCGIGGGLWSTGLAMARYFLQHPHAVQQIQRGNGGSIQSILELGSGNGLLAVCLCALKSAHLAPSITDMVVTDTADHLQMIQTTIAANAHLLDQLQVTPTSTNCTIHVMEHTWGAFIENDTAATTTENDDSSITEKTKRGQFQFDLIVGSDLAYRKDLYDPLIKSFLQFSHHKTIILLGVTMADTTPSFFDKLTEAGFVYQRFADHLMEPEFRGKTFGIFMIKRRE